MVKLTFGNFINYINHPTSSDLNKSDQKIALISSIALGIFTLGLVHLGCYLADLYNQRVGLSVPSVGAGVAQASQGVIGQPAATAQGILSPSKLKALETIFNSKHAVLKKQHLPSKHPIRSFFFDPNFRTNFHKNYSFKDFDYGFENELFGVPLTFQNPGDFNRITQKYPQIIGRLSKDPNPANPFNPNNGNHYQRLANNNISVMLDMCAKEKNSADRLMIYDMISEILSEAIIAHG